MNYNWNWGIFWQPSPNGTGNYLILLSGLVWTIKTALLAWIIALVSERSSASCARCRSTAGAIGFCYVEFFRNMPLLVQLFLWFFVLPDCCRSAGLWLKQIAQRAVLDGVDRLGLFMSARVAEQLRAGIARCRAGKNMAATALGLTTPQAYRYVLLPMAFRIILPPLTSEFLNTIKNTSVAHHHRPDRADRPGARRCRSSRSRCSRPSPPRPCCISSINIVVVTGMRFLERSAGDPRLHHGGR